MSSVTQRAGKSSAGVQAPIETKIEETRKQLQQYKDDDGHFSLVRYV